MHNRKYFKMCAHLLICTIIVMLIAVNQANAVMTMEQIGKAALSVRNTCTSKSHADSGAVAAIQKGEFPDDNQPLKCYTLCIMKTMRTFKNGRIDEGMMIKQMDLMMPPDMAGPLKVSLIKCAAEPPTGDDCETTYQFVKCSYQTDSDHFFFP
ncbi:odorant binding protein 5 isoform X2 [Mycetomoellerius zeteki]|uniref:odorant binding protein 5 isoform X2 n=1 Tax=Mycetomoellerius zeteki TaxID=64791 RepID=UPI00084E4F13|nr:PREDICTED: general odorant-binding protein 19a-like isoform X2 [Trachymyrmex zeteki]